MLTVPYPTQEVKAEDRDLIQLILLPAVSHAQNRAWT